MKKLDAQINSVFMFWVLKYGQKHCNVIKYVINFLKINFWRTVLTVSLDF